MTDVSAYRDLLAPAAPAASATPALAVSPERQRILADFGWRYHPPTGLWWRMAYGRKWRDHESVLAALPDADFRFVAAYPDKAQCASVPCLK